MQRLVRCLKPGGAILFRDYARADLAQLRLRCRAPPRDLPPPPVASAARCDDDGHSHSRRQDAATIRHKPAAQTRPNTSATPAQPTEPPNESSMANSNTDSGTRSNDNADCGDDDLSSLFTELSANSPPEAESVAVGAELRVDSSPKEPAGPVDSCAGPPNEAEFPPTEKDSASLKQVIAHCIVSN